MNRSDNAFDFRLKLLRKLYKTRLLAPSGLYHFVNSISSVGVNLMTLLSLAAKLHGGKIALVDEREQISYEDLYEQARNLAIALRNQYKLEPKQKAAFVCRNNASLVRALFAVSMLGADIYLLNPEMTDAQFLDLAERHRFDIVIYDSEVANLIDDSGFKGKSIPTYSNESPSVESLAKIAQTAKIKKSRSGNIIVLTGGTTGKPKAARRKPSVFNFLNPFFALLVKLDLDIYESAYIATPAYHGFGLASVFMSLVLGIKMYFTARFDAEKGCDLIEKNKIEIVTLVPLMLQRMTNQNAAALNSLSCIISGGAALNPTLVEQTFNKLGDKLFNLYGTSEAGFSVMATPADLRRAPNTIGKKIIGVKLSVLGADDKEVETGKVGRICIKSKWSTSKNGKNFVETGDLGYRDESNYYFLCGRSDEMIVSAGENVYPVELETILIKHPQIEQVAVIGIPDVEFGQRLKAFIVLVANSTLDQTEITNWLSTRAARFQMPAKIEITNDLPITALGKPNKKALS